MICIYTYTHCYIVISWCNVCFVVVDFNHYYTYS